MINQRWHSRDNHHSNSSYDMLNYAYDVFLWLYGSSYEELIKYTYDFKQYFYHGDHLGSSALISDVSGEAYQHLQPDCRLGRYMPYGETFVEQRQSSWSTPYKFTGHERDMATGFDYAHARYYNSDISMFLSVDPLSKDYPSTSSYMYVRGNPVMLIDPTGMSDDEYKLTQQGQIRLIRKTEGPDILYATNQDGSINYDKTTTLKAGTLQNRLEKIPLNNTTGMSGVMITDNESDAIKLFEFCSDNFSGASGAKTLEFGLVHGEKDGVTYSAVFCDNHSTQVRVGHVMIIMEHFLEIMIKYDYHSHPGNEDHAQPSGFYSNGKLVPNMKKSDVRFAAQQNELAKREIDHFMYHPQSKTVTLYNNKKIFFRMPSSILWR